EQTGQSDTVRRLRERAFLVDDLDDISHAGTVYAARPEDIAFIQFSSGSTSEPKGVVLTHANIIANARGVSEVTGFNEHDVSLSWMPLTHDMGLIGFHLMMFANRVRRTSCRRSCSCAGRSCGRSSPAVFAPPSSARRTSATSTI
ncbi:AMP-dependent synthetase and ligase domain protein, partial [mine drainage metagenome]